MSELKHRAQHIDNCDYKDFVVVEILIISINDPKHTEMPDDQLEPK